MDRSRKGKLVGGGGGGGRKKSKTQSSFDHLTIIFLGFFFFNIEKF